MPMKPEDFQQLSTEKTTTGIKVKWEEFWMWFDGQGEAHTIGELKNKILKDFIVEAYREAAAKAERQVDMYYSELYGRLIRKVNAGKAVKAYDGKTAYYAPISVTKRKPKRARSPG